MVRLVGALCQQRERGSSQTYPKDFSLCSCGTDEHHTGTFWIKEIINALKAFSGCKFYPVEPLYTCKLKIKPAFIEVISETIQIVKLCSICKIVNVSVRQYLKEQLPRDFIQVYLLTASNWLRIRQQFWKLLLSQYDTTFTCTTQPIMSFNVGVAGVTHINDKLGSEKVPWLGRDTE
ncbi:hypothetical protein OUZ56_005852 [Daphnia magna]|uniref:Uncharacterized protein n=1 Tax=Daphnia magna TaxID=35525 RepID=A0ABQ9YTY6_9CRUS|nr:hypothetical protein OUZ56_005852 [Daphnia magna]